MSDFPAAIRAGRPILTDGGIETRIMFETSIELDPDVQVAALVSDLIGGPALRRVYEGYVEAARAAGVAIVIGTPTFRASANFVERAGLGGEDAVRELNHGAVVLLRDIRMRAGHRPVHIAGVIGPSGDAYTPSDCLSAEAATAYHGPQARALADAGVDVLYAPTFPALGEALGVARAMAATGLPYVTSFVLGGDGRLLDGTPLTDAVERIDAAVAPAPLFHSLSCVHHSLAARALAGAGGRVLGRVLELKANGSTLTPAELVALDHPEADDPDRFADAMWSLRERFGLRILGGCCGTDDRHMAALARRIAGAAA